MMNLTKHPILFRTIFYSTIEWIALDRFLLPWICKKNMICNWKQISFKLLCKMMGFYVNLFTVDASFEMGPRWIFLTYGPFVIISREPGLIFDKNTCA